MKSIFKIYTNRKWWIFHLKFKPDAARVHLHSILGYLRYLCFGIRCQAAQEIEGAYLNQYLDPYGFGSYNMPSGISLDTPKVVSVIFWWPKPRAVGKQLDQKTFTSIGKKSLKTRGIKSCCSPNGQCVDGIKDICLG